MYAPVFPHCPWPNWLHQSTPTGIGSIEHQALPLSHKLVLICLKSLTRADVYLSRMRTGAVRVDIHGKVVATVTAEEEAYARGRMAKQAQQQARRAGTSEPR
ncbi:ProQ/FINO family protein (plasmid) [Klebsiella sp. WOUb02]